MRNVLYQNNLEEFFRGINTAPENIKHSHLTSVVLLLGMCHLSSPVSFLNYQEVTTVTLEPAVSAQNPPKKVGHHGTCLLSQP